MSTFLSVPFLRSMRSLFPGILLLAALQTPVSGAEEVFEGRVAMKLSENGATQNVDYFVKDERMRIEVDDPRPGSGTMILNAADKKILILMPTQKVYLSMPLPGISAETPAAADDRIPEPKPTGETRTILGHEARQYIVRDRETEFEVWATDELGTFGGLRLPEQQGAAGLSPAQRALANQKFFPLLIIERRNGKEAARVEVTEVEKKTLEASLFEVPADFREMKLPSQPPQ